MHRWVWDLRYPSPRAIRSEYPISAVPRDTPRVPEGPIAIPGEYTVRLTVNGHSLTEPLAVKMDPRVKSSQQELELLLEKQQLLAGMMTENTEAVSEARALREQLQKLTGKAAVATVGSTPTSPGEKISGPLAQAVAAFDKKLTAILGGGGPGGFLAAASPSPTLSRTAGTIGALYGEIDRADAAPTAAQLAAINTAESDATATLKLWQDFRSTDLPALNRQLKSAGLGELQPGSSGRVASEENGDIE